MRWTAIPTIKITILNIVNIITIVITWPAWVTTSRRGSWRVGCCSCWVKALTCWTILIPIWNCMRWTAIPTIKITILNIVNIITIVITWPTWVTTSRRSSWRGCCSCWSAWFYAKGLVLVIKFFEVSIWAASPFIRNRL